MSQSHYEDGRWQLMLHRPLHPAQPKGAGVFANPGLTGVAFVVWDGSNPEARAVSSWVDVKITAPGAVHEGAH